MLSAPLTPNELAARWHLSEATLEKWRWNGKGPKYVKLGGRITYRLADIETFEISHIRESTTDHKHKKKK